MTQYFPADVSLRVSGELADAQKLFPVARQLLSKAIRLKDNGLPVVRLFLPGTDGSLVHCFLHQGLKHLYVQPGPRPIEGRARRLITELEEGVGVVFLMLSGLVRPGTFIPSEDEEGTGAAHEFHPTQVCSDVYSLPFAYQDMVKLGLEKGSGFVEAHFPKPSMYTGAMKRVVQALYGMGRIGDVSIDGDLSGNGAIEVRNVYEYGFNTTHGVIRDDVGIWLIEISKDRGILKMPLPIIEGTELDTYLDFLVSAGDTDTVSVVSEFGGLPSGETFPVIPDELDLAIAEGTVFRIASAHDLDPFYLISSGGPTKGALWADCGWAFSDTGQVLEAHNTCFWYKNFTFASIYNYERSDYVDYYPNPQHYELLVADPAFPDSVVAPIEDRALTAEHWKIDFQSRTLTLVEKSYLAGPQKTSWEVTPSFYDNKDTEMLRVPAGGNTDALIQVPIWGRPPSAHLGQGATYFQTSCPVLVFFKGDTLEVVRHQPERTYSASYPIYTHPQAHQSSPGGYDWSLAPPPGTTTINSGGGLVCTSSESRPPRGPPFPPDEEGSRTSRLEYFITGHGIGHGAPFHPCDGADSVPDVHEYGGTSDYASEGSGTGQFYGGFQFGSTPFKMHYLDSNTRHTEFSKVGQGDNTSFGQVDVDTGYVYVVTYSLVNGTQYYADIEGFIYDSHMELHGSSHDNAWFATGIRNVEPNIWRRSGAFYSTSIDMRRDETWGNLWIYGEPHGSMAIQKANWDHRLGLVIPAYVREGYGFVSWEGGSETFWANDLPHHTDQLLQQYKLVLHVPGLTDGFMITPYTPLVIAKWEQLVNATQFYFSSAVDAGPTKCGIVQNNVYGSIFTPGTGYVDLTPTITYSGSANGIPIDGCSGPNSTFVGAV